MTDSSPAMRRATETAVLDGCRHCGALPDADGDHTCPCPNPDDDCPTHTGKVYRCEHGHKTATHTPSGAWVGHVSRCRPCAQQHGTLVILPRRGVNR